MVSNGVPDDKKAGTRRQVKRRYNTLALLGWGGILALFLTTLLFYPHWLFLVLGIPGTIILYWGTKEEEKRLVKQFGEDYVEYTKRVPRMNIVLGIIRLWLRPKTG